jgi:cell division protein FtsB
VKRSHRIAGALVVSILVVAALLLLVFPTRTYLSQRASTRRAEAQLKVLTAQNEALRKRAAALNTDAEIERIGREQYNLVRPGEEAYAVLPPPQPVAKVLDVWPFTWMTGDR